MSPSDQSPLLVHIFLIELSLEVVHLLQNIELEYVVSHLVY